MPAHADESEWARLVLDAFDPDDTEHEAEVEWGRRSLMGFVEVTHPGYEVGWVHERICAKLEAFSAAVARKESPRLIIVMPPRHGKTSIVSQRFPVRHMASNVRHEVIVASHTQRLANKSSRRARAVARSDLAGEIFGGALGPKDKHRKDKRETTRRRAADQAGELLDQVEEWEIHNGSSYQSVGIGGTINGSGAHVLVVDDYLKDRKAAESITQRDDVYTWFVGTAIQRLSPGGGVIVMATRWHADDLIGRLLEDEKSGGEHYDVLHLPALAVDDEPVLPEDAELAAMCEGLTEDAAGAPCWRLAGEALHPARYDVEKLLARKAAITRRHGLRDWDAQYQGTPISAAGAFIKRHWFRERWTCELSDIVSTADEVWISVDSATEDTPTADWHSLQLWARRGPKRYLLDRVLGKWQYPEFEPAMDAFIARHAHWIIARDGGALLEKTNNAAVYLSIRAPSYKGVMLIAFKPTDSKTFRATYLQRAAEAGAIVLPDSGRHPWVEEVLDCWCAFGTSAHDDDADSASQINKRWTDQEQEQESAVDYEYGW